MDDLDKLVDDAEIEDIPATRLKQRLREERKRREMVEEELADLKKASEIINSTGEVKPKRYRSSRTRKGKVAAVLCHTDWHTEENIDPETIGGLNSFDLEEADRRIEQTFAKQLMMLSHADGLAKVDELVLWWGGDFVNGYIHEELQESNHLGPAEATEWMAERIAGGIDLFRKETKLPIRCVCNCGNHGRTTRRKRISTDYKSNWEYLAYRQLARTYRKDSRVDWIIPKGYFAEVPIQGKAVRFHHGDSLKYAGGVGGIGIPVNKAIASWNKSRAADVDIFGHWHQFQWTWRWISVGCLCGYNAYAQHIKAEYQPPTQAFATIDRERGLTSVSPIFCDRPTDAAQ